MIWRWAVAAGLLLAAIGPAQAAHSHHRHHGAHRRTIAAHGHRNRNIFMSASMGQLPAMRSAIVAEANRFAGRSNPTPYREEWCRDFVNMVAARLGIRLANESHRAIDSLSLGPHVRTPRPGDLAVIGKHHVTIFVGYVGRKIIGLGGNQHHRVQYSMYDASRVSAFVRI